MNNWSKSDKDEVPEIVREFYKDGFNNTDVFSKLWWTGRIYHFGDIKP